MRDSFGRRAAELDAMLRPFARPLPEQTGVVVCVGGRAVAFDGFDRPETLAGLWQRLVRGYAMEALGAREGRVDRGEVEAFLGRLASAQATAHDAVGLGTEVVLTGEGFVASALVWRGAVVHVAAFADVSPRGADRVDRLRGTARSWFHEV